jgi:hypothetical protein
VDCCYVIVTITECRCLMALPLLENLCLVLPALPYSTLSNLPAFPTYLPTHTPTYLLTYLPTYLYTYLPTRAIVALREEGDVLRERIERRDEVVRALRRRLAIEVAQVGISNISV